MTTKQEIEKARDEMADGYFKRDKHPMEKPGDPCSYYAGFEDGIKYALNLPEVKSLVTAMKYAHEDRADQYYLNVKEAFDKLLKELE